MTHDNNNNNCSSSGEVEPVCFLRQLGLVVVVEVVVGAHVLERASSSSNLAECSTFFRDVFPPVDNWILAGLLQAW